MIRASLRLSPAPLLPALLALAGCASHSTPVALAPTPTAPVAAVAVPMPAGGYPGMATPMRLADGGYRTPNRDLTPAATLWHLRVALNVAALACRGPQGEALVTGYNAMLSARKAELARAESTYAAQYRAGGADWRDRYDDAMTRLYNFFSQSPARAGFCAAAAGVIAEAPGVPAEAMPAFAVQRLAVLEAPFTDFYRAYDAWAATQAPVPAPAAVQRPVIAVAATTGVAPPRAALHTAAFAAPTPAASAPTRSVPASVTPAQAGPAVVVPPRSAPVAGPRLEIDPAVFRLP